MAELACARLAPRLIVFSDSTRAPLDLILLRFAALAAAARPKSVLFTLRDYALPARARLAFGSQVRALAERTEQLFGVADRADLARYFDAEALHLPEHGLSPADARRYLERDVFLSRASHDPDRIGESGSDAVLLSPIFEPRKGRPALGVAALEHARSAASQASGGRAVPALYALGGVEARNAASCVAAGASGVALIGAALERDPEPLLAALKISRN